MRYLKHGILFLLLFPILFSCNKELNVNADWEDVTVVYSLLDQGDSVHYLKITKAFLGPGNALEFAKIPDSSNYPDKLDVRIDEYNGSLFLRSFSCDTITIHDKEAGDSVFYYPDQLMYFATANLHQNFTYKLYVKNKQTNKEITSQTTLVHDFTIEKPTDFLAVNFIPGNKNEVLFYSAVGGKRYQVVLRFHYLESLKADTSQKTARYVDWVLFPGIRSLNVTGGEKMDYFYACDGFYSSLGAQIPVDPTLNRAARHVDFIFSVASEDLNTYMEVTEPSNSIVQERPTFSNISNGIGLFASRSRKVIDSLRLRIETLNELKVNSHTKDLGF
jgi:hypothetical protein